MVKGGVHVIEQCSGCGYQGTFPFKAESVQRGDIEVPAQFLRRGIERERPAVGIVGTQQFRRTVARKRILELVFGFEVLNKKFTGGEIKHCYSKTGHRSYVIVCAIVQKAVFRYRSGRDDARDLAADQSFHGLGVLDLVAERRCHSCAYEFRKIVVQCMVWHSAHGSVAAVRKRRAENR